MPADSNAANIIVPNDLDLGINGLNIKVDAYRFYLDDDCGGPNPPVLIQLPFNDPLENWAYVNNLLTSRRTAYPYALQPVTSISGVLQQ